MRTFLRIAGSFVVGLVVSYVAAVAVMLWSMSATNTFDRDGGMSMAIMFAIGPLFGIAGGIVAAIAIPVWLGRRDLARAPLAMPPKQRWPASRRASVAALVSGIAAYAALSFVLRLFAGVSFESYGTALAVSLAPLVLGLAVAALAAVLVLRKARGTT